MLFFRVTENINIKIQDGTLVKFLKLKKPSELINENIYCTTYDDLESIKNVFAKVGEKYKVKIIPENRIRSQNEFPRELGISNAGEYELYKIHNEHIGFYINSRFESIDKQISTFKKGIAIAVVGGVGRSISEIICGMNALRILHEKLLAKFKSVKIDVFLVSSQNQYYNRDKSILEDEQYINAVFPLAISVKRLSGYDFFIDNSSLEKSEFYNELPYIDSYLYKFGIDINSVDDSKKHNQIDLTAYEPNLKLEKKLKELRQKGKLLLFHPYSSDIKRSIPKEIAKSFLQKIIKKADEYIIVSALPINDIKDERFVPLVKYSKSYKDFAYIISNMDAIITADTSTYHISDAFAVPTVVIFTIADNYKRIKYYTQAKAVKIKTKAKNFSNFEFGDEKLSLYRFEGWKELKAGKLLKLF